jgi:hypothetical protein
MTCKFCGQKVVAGGGGHTSSCYEVMLNKSKADNATLRALLRRWLDDGAGGEWLDVNLRDDTRAALGGDDE